jgi:drug/metabolite transporter (DMT)-like permease
LLGSILSLISAAFFGFNSATMRRAVLTGSVLQGISISVPFGVPVFFLAMMMVGSFGLLWEFSGNDYILLSLGGIIHFCFGRYSNYRATKAMGANLVRPFLQLSVILSLALAMVFLDETLTPLRMFGIFLLIVGPLIMLRGRERFTAKIQENLEKSESKENGFVPNYTEGILFAIISAFGFGASPILIRAAIGDMGLTAGITGGMVSYGAATFIILLVLLQPNRLRHVMSMSAVTAKWFLLSAFAITISQMLRFMALAVAPVSVVAPVQQTTVIFQVIMGWFINRDHEAFGIWVILGIFSSFLGAITISLSTELVLGYFDLPQVIVDFARIEWP